MSHNILESDGISYVGERPWHRLGTQLPQGASLDEMIIAAGLDWEVERLPFPNIPDYRSTDDRFVIGRRARYDDCGQLVDPGHVIDIVGNRFQPIQNRDMFATMQLLLESCGLSMNVAGSVGNGEMVWCLADTNRTHVLRGDDPVKSYVLMINSHKRGVSFQVFQTNVRVVCQNTISLALRSRIKDEYFRLNHGNRNGLDVDAQKRMAEILKLGTEQFDTFCANAEKLAAKRMTDRERILFFLRVTDWDVYNTVVTKGILIRDAGDVLSLEDKEGKQVFTTRHPFYKMVATMDDNPGHNLESAKGTAWGAYNTVTHFTEHLSARDPEQGFLNNTSGKWAELKTRSLEDLLAL